MPGKPGQQATAAAEQQQGGGPQAEEFPSLAEVKQQEQQRRRPLAAKRAPAKKKGGETAAAQEPAQQQGPLLLGFPGWQPPAAALAAAGLGGDAAQLAAASAAGGRPQQRGKQQGQQRGKPQPSQQQQQAPPAGTEQANILLGAEYESVQGQRLLLTPVLLAAALQSSLDSVAVRQQAPTAAAVGPGPRTAVAAAAAAQASPGSAAAFLLHQDLPLWLQLPGEQLAQLAGGKRRSGPGGAAGGGAAERPVWLQLRRLLVATPEAAVPFEAAPKLLVEVPRDMLAPPVAPAMPSDTGAGSGPAGRASQAGATAPGTVQLQYSLAAPLALPQGSFCCIALPWLLTAPTLGASGGVSLIRQSGPIRAAVAAHTVVRPQQEAAAA